MYTNKFRPGTHRQTKDLAIRVLNLNPELINGQALQGAINGCSVEEVERKLVVFINNGLDFFVKLPSHLSVDRTTPFDVRRHYQGYAEIWRGPKNGNGLLGQEEQNSRSLHLVEVDFARASFTTTTDLCTSGEEMLTRDTLAGYILLDGKIGECLLDERGQVTLEWLYCTFGITCIAFPGTVLRMSDGTRQVPLLCRRGTDTPWVMESRFLLASGYPFAVFKK